MLRPKLSHFQVMKQIISAYLFGIPTPYSFRLRPRAYQVLMGVSQELSSLRIKYDFALDKNTQQADSIEILNERYKYACNDAKTLQDALRELINHPNVLSPKTQEVVNSLKVKNEHVN